MFLYDDVEDWVTVSSGLADVLGVEISGRVAKVPGDPAPGRFAPDFVKGLATALAVVGTRPSHGSVELVLLTEDQVPLQALFVWDPEVEGSVGRVLRVVRITDNEADLVASVMVERFCDALIQALGRLVIDLERGDALGGDEALALRQAHPRRGPETVHVPVVQWFDDGETVHCLISEQAASAVRAWSRRGSVLTVRGPTQAVSFRCGPPSVQRSGATLVVQMPASALQGVILPQVVDIPGLSLQCCAMGVTPTGEPESLVAHGVSRGGPRVHHYAFTYKMLPTLLPSLRLAEPGSTTRLTQAWAGTGERITARDATARFLPPVARGAVPGTRVHGVVGLGVVSVRDIDGWRVAVAQMPLTEGPTEAFYMAVAERDGSHRLLSWERTSEGLAVLGEWWPEGEEIRSAHADFHGSPYVGSFYDGIGRWLQERPQHPTTKHPPDAAASPVDLRPTGARRVLGLAAVGTLAVAGGLLLWWWGLPW